MLEAQGADGSAAVEGNGRSVEGEKGITGKGVNVVDILVDGQGIVGGAVAEGEKDIIIDGVNGTVSLESKGLIGGSIVTEGCLVNRSVTGVEDCERGGGILTSCGENNASVFAMYSVGTGYINDQRYGLRMHDTLKRKSEAFPFTSRK